MAVIQAGVMPVFMQALEFRNDGQIMSQRSQHLSQPVLTQDYAYDRTQQLIGWDNDLGGSVQSKSYAYDAVGNRLQTIESGFTDTYSYGNTLHPNQLTQVANASQVMSFLYDQNGSQTQKITKPVSYPNDSIVESFSWSYASRLLKYSTSSFESTVETNEQWEYTYGPRGERQSKRRTWRSTGLPLETTHPWVYYGITGAQQLSTWHGRQALNDSCYLGQHVWMYPQEYIAYGGGSVHAIELTPSNNKRYKFTDHLGTTRLVVNDRNALVTQRDTKPFGGELFLFGVDTRKGFIDKEADSESGLSDFSARKYGEVDGRFTTIDPLWQKYPNISPYVYSSNSPLIYLDPTGLELYVEGENDAERDASLEDIRSLVPEEYRELITYDKGTGKVTFESSNLSASDCEFVGVDLVHELVISEFEFVYTVSKKTPGLRLLGYKNGKPNYAKANLGVTKRGEIDADFLSAIINITDINGITSSDNSIKQLPSPGVEGLVRILPGTFYADDNSSNVSIEKPRSIVVFHELVENYIGVIDSRPYHSDPSTGLKGSHEEASDREMQFIQQMFPSSPELLHIPAGSIGTFLIQSGVFP